MRIASINLVSGVSRINFWTYIYAAFICVGMMAAMNFVQGFILTEHLRLPEDQQGKIAGDLAFWTEITAVILLGPFGALSDSVGRKVVLIAGTLLIGIGYGLYPFATSIPELIFYRLIYAVGAAATVAAAITIQNDYPEEQSRGKMIGFTSIMNGLGIVAVAGFMGSLPKILTESGMDAVTAGKFTLGGAGVICILSAVIFTFGLKDSSAINRHKQPRPMDLLRRGLRSAKNPRIALSYGCAFTARSDLAINGLFISLWAIQVGNLDGITTAEALSRVVIVIAVSNGVALIWAPLFGMILDRVNRVTGVAISLGLAALGFLSMSIITSPLDYAMLPFFILLGIGANSAIMASVVLVGQEAAPEERGTVIGVSGIFGALGILFATAVGGRLFDSWAPYAPFVLLGSIQALLFAFAVFVRLNSPGNEVRQINKTTRIP